MNQHLVARIAIYILSVIMIIFGIFHFKNPRELMEYIPDIPGGITWVYVTGAAFILAALSFILNQWVRVAAYLLALMLILFIVLIHIPNYMHAGMEATKNAALTNLLKDAAIAAFALHIAGSADRQHMKF